MIVLTRFSSERIAINADLVARVETNPDTRVTLIDGSRYIVTESMQDVIRLVEEHKARVLVLAQSLPVTGERTPLGIVPARPDIPRPDIARPDAVRPDIVRPDAVRPGAAPDDSAPLTVTTLPAPRTK